MRARRARPPRTPPTIAPTLVLLPGEGLGEEEVVLEGEAKAMGFWERPTT